MKKATEKEQAWLDALFATADLNQAEATRQTYKSKDPNVLGSQIAKRPHIKAAIDKFKLERSKRTKVDADYLLTRLHDEAEADIADLYFENGSLKPVHQWPKIFRQGLVAGIDVEQQFVYEQGEKIPDGFVTKIKLSDRAKRLEMLGKHVNVKAFDKEIIAQTTNNIMVVPSATSAESWEEQAKKQQDDSLKGA